MTGDAEGDATAPADRAGVAGSGVAAEVAVLAARRYEPLEEVARGGAGRIVRARDRAFDRIVALKEPLDPIDGGDRLRAEAAILASLSHPSIVPVYDHGTRLDGVPFFAMKLVDGRSLRDVIRDAPRLEQRLALIPQVVAIAEAVAYAHARGVIHRDLKPGNVLIGAFGETIVIDWGLAKQLDAGPITGDGDTVRSSTISSTDTRTGSVMGTPAYMAPEQARGVAVDTRADVYALGAILYHVLAGAAPYAGRDGRDVIAAVLEGPPPPIEELQPRVPADLAAIVAKAMARTPGDRYPDAAGFAEDLVRFQTGRVVAARRYSLLARLRRFARRRRGWIAAAVFALASAAVAIWLTPKASPPRPGAQCARAGDRVREVWNPTRRAAVATAFAGTGRAYAPGVADLVLPRIDRAADALGLARVEACEATEARGERTQAQLALRMGCLDQQLAQLDATVAVMTKADGAVVDGAPRVIAALDDPRACDDVEVLARRPPEPVGPGIHERLEALRHRLTVANAEIVWRREAGVIAESRAIDAEAAQLGYCPVAVKAQQQLAIALARIAGNKADALAAHALLRKTILAADACGEDLIRANALLNQLSLGVAEPAELDRIAEEVQAIARRVDDPRLRLRVPAELAGLARARGQLDRAIELGEQAVAAAAARPDLGDPAPALNLGLALADKGDLERAQAIAIEGLAAMRALYGRDNPAVGQAAVGLAMIYIKRGHPELAEPELAEALRVALLRGDPEDHAVLRTKAMLGSTRLASARYAEAAAVIEETLPVAERVLGTDHDMVTSMRSNLATAYRMLDRTDEALAIARANLASRVRVLGPDHVRTATSRQIVGEILEDRGDHVGAVAELRTAFALQRAVLDARSPDLATTKLSLARALLSKGAAAEALPLARSTLPVFEAANNPAAIAVAELAIARALWRTGGDRAEARRLAASARDRPDAEVKTRAAATAWLADPR